MIALIGCAIALMMLLLACPLARPASPTEELRALFVVEPASADAPLVRVRVGPFSDRWAAASKVREIEAGGNKPFVAAPQRD